MVANVAVWVEDHDGTIVRGLAETVTAGGARIRLSSMPGFGQGAGWPSASASTPRAPRWPPPLA